jgi:hypothetical protein
MFIFGEREICRKKARAQTAAGQSQRPTLNAQRPTPNEEGKQQRAEREEALPTSNAEMNE